MIEVGRLCMKIAGRDAGSYGLIVEVLDGGRVLFDGQGRRRNVNVNHLEPTDKVAKLTKGAAHASVVTALKGLGVKVAEPKKVPRKKKAAAEAKPTKKGSEKKASKPKKAAAKKTPAKKAPLKKAKK